MTIDELAEICRSNGLDLTNEQVGSLGNYSDLLRDWNSKINLISRKDEENLLSKHILHSLTLRMPAISGFDFQQRRVLDIGTGGGLPGIPMSIATPSASFLLVDSIQKKINACSDMIAKLELPNAKAQCGRAEEIAKLPVNQQKFDVVISRAVAPLEDLIKWTSSFMKPAATLFSLKGGALDEEIAQASKHKRVRSVQASDLVLAGYDEFVREEKKLVRVDLK